MNSLQIEEEALAVLAVKVDLLTVRRTLTRRSLKSAA
jgi:hypothetical protein